MNLNKLHASMKDDMGRYRTQSLFWELRYGVDAKYPPIFTLKQEDIIRDGVEYLSLKKLYMAYDHVPGLEYEFAMDVFNSWDHWQKLQGDTIPGIKDEIRAWREELDIRIKAKAIKALMTSSLDNDAKGVNAAKYLVEKGYLSKRGRPSKEELEREKKQILGINKDVASDLERIGLKVVNNA